MILPGYVFGAPKLSITKMGYVIIKEHWPLLLVSQDLSPQLECGQSSPELIICNNTHLKIG